MEFMISSVRELKFADDSNAMSFSGYGAVFGNVDADGDVIEPGAFAKSLAAHKAAGSKPLMLLEHGFGASLPIGVWDEMSEDGTGLVVKGRLLDTTAGRDTYTAMKANAISGLSIGYRATEFEKRTKPEDPRRRLKAVDLIEVSVVGLPANAQARVGQVKSRPATIREFEELLRDVAGFSSAEAKRVASHGFKSLDAMRDAGEGLSELAAALKRSAAVLKT